METKVWFGIAVFFWLLGFIPSFLGLDRGDKLMRVPKWLSVFLFSRSQNISMPSIFLQMWGILIAVYAVALNPFISDRMVSLLIGMLLPAFLVRLIMDALQK